MFFLIRRWADYSGRITCSVAPRNHRQTFLRLPFSRGYSRLADENKSLRPHLTCVNQRHALEFRIPDDLSTLCHSIARENASGFPLQRGPAHHACTLTFYTFPRLSADNTTAYNGNSRTIYQRTPRPRLRFFVDHTHQLCSLFLHRVGFRFELQTFGAPVKTPQGWKLASLRSTERTSESI